MEACALVAVGADSLSITMEKLSFTNPVAFASNVAEPVVPAATPPRDRGAPQAPAVYMPGAAVKPPPTPAYVAHHVVDPAKLFVCGRVRGWTA